MKINRFLPIFFIVLTASSISAHAQSPQVTVGVKTWLSTYEYDETDYGERYNDESDLAFFYGPSLSVRYDRFLLGANYITGTYTFSTDIIDVDFERTDLDLYAGYYFIEKLAFVIGHKSVDVSISPGDEGSGASGYFFGFTGYYPIGEKSALYGTFIYTKITTEGESEHINGPGYEFGFASRIPDSPMSYSIGFKGQEYEWESDDPNYESTDSFVGLTFGLNYTF